jgi:hypothetical protein
VPNPAIKSFPSISAAMAAIKEELAGGKDFTLLIEGESDPSVQLIVEVDPALSRAADPHTSGVTSPLMANAIDGRPSFD